MNYDKFYNGHKCMICGYSSKNRRSLGNHLNRSHKISIQEYILKYMFEEEVPLCKCGCRQKVKWHKTKYRYNEYINGHNDAGFDIGTYKHTKEQVNKRNDAIRKAYKDKKKEISNKISDSVNLAWQDPAKVANNSKGKKILWNDKKYHKKMTAKRKQVWNEQGDELRKKIFTPEFGKKIALANMRRDNKRTSKKEKAFLKHLQSVGLDVVEGKWFNRKDMVKHFDGYIHEKRLLIEYDGTYWHALDREEDFRYEQVVSIINDFKKNRLASMEKWALVRIREDVDLSKIVDYNSLIENSYHYQDCDGNIVKDGFFKLADKTPLITKELLAKLHVEKGKEYVEKNFLPLVKEFLKEYVLCHGWFYPPKKHTLQDAVDEIVCKAALNENQNVFSSMGSEATAYLKSLFQSFWNVSRGPHESFWDDTSLERVIKYRLGVNNSKLYKYSIDGKDVFCNELFDISLHNIRRGFVVQRKSVSFFKPKVAFELYYKFLYGKESSVVWDPSCGFGARMLGFYAYCQNQKVNGTYIGTEPASQTYDDLLLLKNEMEMDSNFNCEILKQGSEYLLPVKHGIVDLVFTSPPYFDKEKYFDEDEQCWKKYPDIHSWKEEYLLPTFDNAYLVLKDGGKMVININKELRDCINECASRVGFSFVEEMKLAMNRDHFAKKKGNDTKKIEPILVYSKI